MTTGQQNNQEQGKPVIMGQSRSLKDEEAAEITEMIRETQQSARQLTIPQEDLDTQATTHMRPEVARVIAESHVRDLLNRFNRDYLYGMGRFDEYSDGLLLKWGDGYSRKHIWITAEGDNLVFETSHARACGKPFCQNGKHVFPPDLWHDIRVINVELGEQFRRPVYEKSDD
ncbi:MAG TPA: hypothetical protein VKQ36_05535 [Ktedonobacterales bacterium]|nr:hypothetical protein [Ktedonobacterales bacterium]